MRISYVHGPGDAFGTFQHWRRGEDDPRLVKQTYSSQFFELVAEEASIGQLICLDPSGPSGDSRFVFETVKRTSASGLRFYREEYRYARAVGRKVSSFSPDVVIVNADFPLFALDVLQGSREIILSLHNTFWEPFGTPRGLKQRVFTELIRIALRRANYAVCVSEECRRQFISLKKNTRAEAVLQLPRFTTDSTEPRRGRVSKLLYVGRVEIEKGVGDLISAFAIVSDELPDLSLDIVGDGSALTELKKRVAELGIASRVIFQGRGDAALVAKAYKAADLCICPTQVTFNEGLATIPFEAAAYGLPTIMSRVVPAREYFTDNAIICQPNNPQDLAMKIRLVVLNADIYRAACEDATESLKSAMSVIPDWKAGVSSLLHKITA